MLEPDTVSIFRELAIQDVAERIPELLQGSDRDKLEGLRLLLKYFPEKVVENVKVLLSGSNSPKVTKVAQYILSLCPRGEEAIVETIKGDAFNDIGGFSDTLTMVDDEATEKLAVAYLLTHNVIDCTFEEVQ